jgi:two-component system nitrogen regulation sensor histidine kinase NtrY
MRDAVTLQKAGQPNVTFETTIENGEIWADLDSTMMSQALTNLIKNAGEAIESLQEKFPEMDVTPQIRISLSTSDDMAEITIADNGIGLPEDRAKLFEPYVTTREKGTGLGLPIVKKIIDEHGGTLILTDAPAFDDTGSYDTGSNKTGRYGAMAVIHLPIQAALALPQTETA